MSRHSAGGAPQWIGGEPMPSRVPTPRLRSPAWLLEAFVASNLLFLVADIALAHSANEFGHPAEWIPLWFSAIAGLGLAATLIADDPRRGTAGALRELVGWLNDNVFGEQGIASSIVVLALVSGPLGLLFAWLSLKPYTREILAAEVRGD